jgi:hypothetical protein
MQRTVVPLQPGYYFAPGFYMDYWINGILKNIPHYEVLSNGRLQKHREMLVGAIIAAANSIAGPKLKTFAGLSETTHPDLDLAYFEEATLENGVKGNIRKHIYVEVTRCNLDAGEDLLTQILKKNTATNTENAVAVHVFGKKASPDIKKVYQALQSEKIIYPKQIIAVGSVAKAGSIYLPDNSFGISMLWPSPGSSIINLSDKAAFFRDPDVMPQPLKRATGFKEQNLGGFTLLLPELN